MTFKMRGWSAFTKKTDGKGDEFGKGSDHGKNNSTSTTDNSKEEYIPVEESPPPRSSYTTELIEGPGRVKEKILKKYKKEIKTDIGKSK